ncbi:MAG: hypothetical protein WCP10_13145 [Desulfuromonadales bacterium]
MPDGTRSLGTVTDGPITLAGTALDPESAIPEFKVCAVRVRRAS